MKNLTIENFENVAKSEKGLFIIKFSSETCGPCKTMAPVMEALDKQNDKVNVYEVDTGASPELAGHFGVRGVPTIAFCENREVVHQVVGVTPLRDLQYIIDNIDDPYFREHGEFNLSEAKKDHTFTFVLIGLAIIFLLAFSFL